MFQNVSWKFQIHDDRNYWKHRFNPSGALTIFGLFWIPCPQNTTPNTARAQLCCNTAPNITSAHLCRSCTWCHMGVDHIYMFPGHVGVTWPGHVINWKPQNCKPYKSSQNWIYNVPEAGVKFIVAYKEEILPNPAFFSKFPLKIILDETVMSWALLSIKWEITFKIMAHHSSILWLSSLQAQVTKKWPFSAWKCTQQMLIAICRKSQWWQM